VTEGVCVLEHRDERLRPAGDGHLCLGCSTRLTQQVRALPNLWSDLADVLAGPWNERVVDDPNPLTAAENPLPLKPAVADHRGLIVAQTASWARLVAEERDERPPVPDVGRICAWLLDRQPWVVRQEWVDEYAQEVFVLYGRARALLDTGRRGYTFLGRCEVETERHGYCQAEVYAPDDAEWATCPGCGIEHRVSERREWLRERARDHNGTLDEVVQFASTYLMRELKPDTVQKWVTRGKILRRGTNADGLNLYRVEDVIAQAEQGRKVG
jgi:hypothetical protein